MKGAGGGKRGGRKPTRVESDDRPRGYEATRMRQLWRDIDHAKHKAGLGRTPEPAPPQSWDVGTIIEQAAALIGGAASWVTANAPAALALLATGAELLRGVPLVGRLVELMPPADAPAPPRGPAPPPRHSNGAARTITVDPDEVNDPDGGWVH